MEIIVAAFTTGTGKQVPHTDNTAMMKQNSCSISTTQSIQSFGRFYLNNSILSKCIIYAPTANGSHRGTKT